jgi:hypothetical protein
VATSLLDERLVDEPGEIVRLELRRITADRRARERVCRTVRAAS